MWKPKRTQRVKKVLRKENRVGRITFSHIRLYYKAAVIKTLPYWQKKKKKTHKFMEQDRQSRNKLMHVWPMNLQQKKEEYTIEKRQPSINGAGKTGQQRVKSKIETFSNTLYKIKLKMD